MNFTTCMDIIWDSLLLTLPVLHNDPVNMRVFDAPAGGSQMNCGLFRPLVQTNILAPLAN